LNGEKSYWEGSSFAATGWYSDTKYTSIDYKGKDSYGDVEHFYLTLANGAKWNATGDSFVNKLTLEGKGNKLEGNGHELDIQKFVFTNGSELVTQLNTAYSGIQTKNNVLTYATATYQNIEVDGTASLVIEDKLTYSVDGLNALKAGYKDLNVILGNASLYIDPTTIATPVIINSGITVKLLAKGADTDVASGAKLNISGAVHVINDGTTTEAKLGKAEVLDGGSLQVETKVAAVEIKLNDGAQLNVGNNDTAGRLTAEKLTVSKGGKVFLDPNFIDGVSDSSEAAFNLDGSLDGQIIVGQNSKLVIGSTEIGVLDSALEAVGTSVSEAMPAALYINTPVTLGSEGLLAVNGAISDLTTDDATALQATKGLVVAQNNTLIVNAAAGMDGKTVITGTSESEFTVDGQIYVDNAVAGKEVALYSGFDESRVSIANDPVAVSQLIALERVEGKLVASTDTSVTGATIASNTLAAVTTGEKGTGTDRINKIFARTNGLTKDQAVQAMNSIALMGTASAAQAVAINAANMIADGLEQHGSVLASFAHDKTGADLWIDLNGSFSKAGRYQAATTTYGYKSDLAGATIGADYAFGNGSAVGAAFSFGTGSARGQGNGAGIKNDIEYYGFNIYGAHNTKYANFIATLGYTLSKNEISQQGYKGKPDVNTFSVGIRAEKDFKVTDSLAITPHIGIRYLNVDMDNFTAGGFKYTAKKVNITEVPVGVAFNANLKAPCGADVKPFADFTIAPAMGSKKASNKFGLVGSAASDTIRSRVANSNLYQGKIGVNATQGNHSLSFSYGIGAGSDSRVDQALQAKYRYSF
jgi:hypothetical protein